MIGSHSHSSSQSAKAIWLTRFLNAHSIARAAFFLLLTKSGPHIVIAVSQLMSYPLIVPHFQEVKA